MRKDEQPARVRKGHRLSKALLVIPFVAAAGWLGHRSGARRSVALPPALSGERREFDSPAGRLSYYVAAPDEPPSSADPPLLLIHSVNAAASAYEVRPLFDAYRPSRTVYALDLPGFGFSDRSDRPYTPRLMTDAVLAMVDEIARRQGVTAIDALAVSLGCEFLARAAAERPAAFRSLALVSPTGFGRGAPRDGPPGSTRGRPRLKAVFTFPLWAKPFYALLTSRPSLRYFLGKTWGSKAIDEGLLAYDDLTSHQPGAEHAPYAFISGFLFSNDIDRVYRSLGAPVWMAHGARGDFTDYGRAGEVKNRPNWTVAAFATGALPYFEEPGAFCDRYEAFLSEKVRTRVFPGASSAGHDR